MARRYVTVAAGLATAVFAVLLPAAGTAAQEPDRRALLFELNDAIEDEIRALKLLAKVPPRRQAAALALDRSSSRLNEIADAVQGSSLSESVGRNVALARWYDDEAARRLRGLEAAPRTEGLIADAYFFKARASGALRPASSASGSQCADGRDNDGDRLVDARYDSGCTNAKDGSEKSPLTCSLGYAHLGELYAVQGACSGPFGKIEINAPRGTKFNTKQMPAVRDSLACYTWASGSRLDCVMRDGAGNPRHVVEARFGYMNTPGTRQVRVRIKDLSGRARTWTLSLKEPTPPSAPPFSLGSGPVPATGTFTNGRGGCPVATSFTDSFQFFAPGDGTLTITQPKTGDRVSGPIKPNGSFQLKSSGESYDGKITGNTATATYSYTASGCTETYDASFVLQR